MKNKIVISTVAVMFLGFVFSTALARSEKAEANASNIKNNQPAEVDEQGQVQPVDEIEIETKANGKEVKVQTKNAGEDKNIRTSTGDDIINKNTDKKGEKIEAVGQKISKGLKDVAEREPRLRNDLVELADELEENQGEVAGSVKKIENKNKIKTFFTGSDYKNLGQLRSSMVQNRNQIRQLTQLIEQTEDQEAKTVLQEQLRTMVQEREDINTLINDEEDTFSLFGWAFRLINGYSENDLDDQEELELQREVEEALVEEEEQLEESFESGTPPAVPNPAEIEPEIIN
jgi:hypothetical protein